MASVWVVIMIKADLARARDRMVGLWRKVGDNEVVATGADVDAMIHDTARTRVTPVATSAKINQLSHFQAIDLEPIDFEHFIDEPDLDRPNMEKMFRKNRAWFFFIAKNILYTGGNEKRHSFPLFSPKPKSNEPCMF